MASQPRKLLFSHPLDDVPSDRREQLQIWSRTVSSDELLKLLSDILWGNDRYTISAVHPFPAPERDAIADTFALQSDVTMWTIQLLEQRLKTLPGDGQSVCRLLFDCFSNLAGYPFSAALDRDGFIRALAYFLDGPEKILRCSIEHANEVVFNAFSGNTGTESDILSLLYRLQPLQSTRLSSGLSHDALISTAKRLRVIPTVVHLERSSFLILMTYLMDVVAAVLEQRSDLNFYRGSESGSNSDPLLILLHGRSEVVKDCEELTSKLKELESRIAKIEHLKIEYSDVGLDFIYLRIALAWLFSSCTTTKGASGYLFGSKARPINSGYFQP